jgi:hypothetical protein
MYLCVLYVYCIYIYIYILYSQAFRSYCGHGSYVQQVRFTSDDDYLVTAGASLHPRYIYIYIYIICIATACAPLAARAGRLGGD